MGPPLLHNFLAVPLFPWFFVLWSLIELKILLFVEYKKPLHNIEPIKVLMFYSVPYPVCLLECSPVWHLLLLQTLGVMSYNVSIAQFACCIQSHIHQSTTILQAILLQTSYAHVNKVTYITKALFKNINLKNMKYWNKRYDGSY